MNPAGPTPANDLILGTSEIGHVYGGYVYLGAIGRFVSAVPGAGDYLGETIHIVGYSPGNGELTFDWYVGDGPQPFGASGDFDEVVEVGIQCEMSDPPVDAASGVTSIETCTYTSDDPSIVLGPTTAEVTLIDVGTAGDATGSISYYTARTDTGVVRGGLIDADGTRRWAGIVDGLGEIAGTVHEVGWAETDENGVTTGVMTLSFDLGYELIRARSERSWPRRERDHGRSDRVDRFPAARTHHGNGQQHGHSTRRHRS